MPRVYFGPENVVDDDFQGLVNYLVTKLNPKVLILDHFCKSRGKYFLACGDYKVNEKVSLCIEKFYDKPVVTRDTIYQTYKGYFDTESLEDLSELVDESEDWMQEFNANLKETLKILSFDYTWDEDIDIPPRPLNTVHLPPKIMKSFCDDIENFFSDHTIERYKRLNVPHSRVYMLHGPPGTGKSSLIQGAATHFNKNIAFLSITPNMTDGTLKRAFVKVPKNTFLCLEDVDCLFSEQRKSEESHLTFSGFLNIVDGVNRLPNGLVIFVTTNHLEKLDGALKRRVDYFIKFDFSTRDQIQSMFKRFLPDQDFGEFWKFCKNLKVTPSILQKFFMRNLPFAELEEFCAGEHGLESLPSMYT